MRYALIFAGVAAAYDAYGYEGYPESKASSSTPAVKYSTSAPAYGGYGQEHKTSSAPAPSKSPSSSQLGYTTIYPGYGKEPVTVTSQYQPYPTCGAAGSDGKSCNKWNEDKYVSTVINDYNSKKVTVTCIDKPITVYQTKTTITHYPTASSGKASPTGSYGSYDAKKNATQPWYEMNEKVHEIKYKDLGEHGLPGYGGSGLCKSCDEEQPYKIKEYKDGKWSEYETTAIYKAPTPETKTYDAPGVYTEPAKDVTVTYTMTKPSEATTTARAGVSVTYGGYTTDFKSTGVQTCAYGAYETGKDKNGKDVTSTVVKTVTVTVSTTGKYEVAKPTTTVYAHDTEVHYPTVSVYQPGVYHKDAQTVTITKSGDSASCEYKQTKTYSTPAASKTPTYGGEYPHGGKSSSKPSVETKTESKPYYPASTPSVSKSSSTPDNKYPATSSAPHYGEYSASSSTPVYDTKKSSSTPCASSSSKPSVETKTYSQEYPHSTPVYSSSVPIYESKTSSVHYPEYPASSSTPIYSASTPVYSQKSSSTPCSSSSKPSVETKTSSKEYPHSTPVYSTSTPAYESKTYPASSSTPCSSSVYSTSTPVYGEYKPSSSKPSVETKTKSEEYPPAKTSSVPVYPATSTVPHYESSKSTPCPSSTSPAGYKSSPYPEYPATSSSAPVYDAKPTPTPAHYDDSNKFSYAPSPSKTSAAYPDPSADYPEDKGSYETGKGSGYAKRAGVVQRRQAAVAKRSNREIVV
ncbi:hypothetical protein E8E11_003207 [Didymella keratinophila]|nr:hypothetical protein E8E11_003207 [Didymella keratinophila]